MYEQLGITKNLGDMKKDELYKAANKMKNFIKKNITNVTEESTGSYNDFAVSEKVVIEGRKKTWISEVIQYSSDEKGNVRGKVIRTLVANSEGAGLTNFSNLQYEYLNYKETK